VTSDDIMTSLLKQIINIDQNSRNKPLCSVFKLSTESVGSRRELVANCVHTADADAAQLYRAKIYATFLTKSKSQPDLRVPVLLTVLGTDCFLFNTAAAYSTIFKFILPSFWQFLVKGRRCALCTYVILILTSQTGSPDWSILLIRAVSARRLKTFWSSRVCI